MLARATSREPRRRHVLVSWGNQDWVAATAASSRARRDIDMKGLSEERKLKGGQKKLARQAGYTFGLSSSEDHKGLLTAQKDRRASCSEVIADEAEYAE